jgi:hypothetical protein
MPQALFSFQFFPMTINIKYVPYLRKKLFLAFFFFIFSWLKGFMIFLVNWVKGG